MGRIKTKLVKRVTDDLLTRHKTELSDDFQKNKVLVGQFVDVPSKKIRNTIAGYVTRLVKVRKDI